MPVVVGRNKVALYGNLDIIRDKARLELARELLDLATKVDALSADPNLPDWLPQPARPETVRNPFH